METIKLRRLGEAIHEIQGGRIVPELCNQAADEIERLDKENQRLRETLEKATAWVSELVDDYQQCNPMTCEYCAGMRTIESLYEVLKGGESK